MSNLPERLQLMSAEKRLYTLEGIVHHLYEGQAWLQLFEVLNNEQYGQAKLQHDPSTHSYAQDLDLGRRAASWEGWTLKEGIALLPRLWRYTLLRCSLTSRAAQYPPGAFRLLVLLKRKQEALGLVDLLADPFKRVQALLQIAEQLLEQPDQEKEGLALLLQASEIACIIQDNVQRKWALRNVATALTQAQQWEQAHAVIGTIEDRDERAQALVGLATAFTQVQQWEQAQVVIGTIEDSDKRARALVGLATAFTQVQQWEQAHAVIGTIEDSYGFRRASALTQLATALAQAQQWEQAHAVIGTIEDSYYRAEALTKLATALTQAQQWELAQAAWKEAQALIGTIPNSSWQAQELVGLATALAQVQQWEQAQALWQFVWEEAQAVIGTTPNNSQRTEVLQDLVRGMAATCKNETLLHGIYCLWRLADEREDALVLFPMVTGFIPRNPELGFALLDAYTWVDTVIKGQVHVL